jgi:hypothetical protein
MPYAQAVRELTRRLVDGRHEYVTVLALILVLKALTYAASVYVHGAGPFSWHALELLPTISGIVGMLDGIYRLPNMAMPATGDCRAASPFIRSIHG